MVKGPFSFVSHFTTNQLSKNIKGPLKVFNYLHAGRCFMLLFFCLQIIFNVTFINYILSVKQLDPDHVQRSVWSDLGPNCL